MPFLTFWILDNSLFYMLHFFNVSSGEPQLLTEYFRNRLSPKGGQWKFLVPPSIGLKQRLSLGTPSFSLEGRSEGERKKVITKAGLVPRS